MLELRFVPVLILLGAYFARGVFLEQRFEDAPEIFRDVGADIVERDDEFFAAQHQRPLAQTDDPLIEGTSIDANLNSVDSAINSVEHSDVQNPQSEDDQPAKIHSILKRVPDLITFTERFFTTVVITSKQVLPVYVTLTTGTVVISTEPGLEPTTVTKPVFKYELTTEVFTESGTIYEAIFLPARVTATASDIQQEFPTSTFVAETLTQTVTVVQPIGAPSIVFVPGTRTITERLVKETVTQTVTITWTYFQTSFIPLTTQTFIADGCPRPTTVTQKFAAAVPVTGCPRPTTVTQRIPVAVPVTVAVTVPVPSVTVTVTTPEYITVPVFFTDLDEPIMLNDDLHQTLPFR